MTRKFIPFIFLILPSLAHAQAEASSVSASVYEIALDSAISKLNKTQLAVYTGREYYPYFLKDDNKYKYGAMAVTTAGPRPGEHPFFISDDFRSEKIEFDGVVYPNINLAYDICKSEVVVLNPERKALVIPTTKVKRFTYAGHSFQAFVNVNGLKTDFYDVLYGSDSVNLCVKRRKNMTELWRTISDYYIVLNNQAYPVSLVSTKSKSVGIKATVLKIFADKEDQVRSYIRQNKLKFTKAKKEKSLQKVVEYYASLKTS